MGATPPSGLSNLISLMSPTLQLHSVTPELLSTAEQRDWVSLDLEMA